MDVWLFSVFYFRIDAQRPYFVENDKHETKTERKKKKCNNNNNSRATSAEMPWKENRYDVVNDLPDVRRPLVLVERYWWPNR